MPGYIRFQRFHCMSPPSDKNSTLLPTQDHVDAPKRIAVIRDKKIILASILTVLIVSSAALILATIALAKLSSDLARLDSVNAGLNARLDQLGSQLSQVSGFLISQELNINSISSQLNDMSARLSARVNSSVELYSSCYKDTVACRIEQHPDSAYWYLCNTPFLLQYVSLNIIVL